MRLTDNEQHLLANWYNLTSGISTADLASAKRLLVYEREHQNRPTFIKRIKQRIVGAADEIARKELE